MAKFQVAHIQHQGQQMIIVLLNSQFQYSSDAEQVETQNYLQRYATSAGLAGTVVLACNAGNRPLFIAPKNLHKFFNSITWADVVRNVNTELTCGD